MDRIFQTTVAPLFPAEGPVRVFLVGEAPGPRGADKSGIPFWGDRAGIAVYRALEAAELAEVPAEAYGDWDGAHLKAKGYTGVLGMEHGNAKPGKEGELAVIAAYRGVEPR